MSRRTLKLDLNRWDLTLTGAGDIAVATEDYATAQDVANAIRLFRNDAYLAWDDGVPHFALDLGLFPSLAAVRARYREAALGVENVREANVIIDDMDETSRVMSGVVNIATVNGSRAAMRI
jgi:hypothetical protein